MGVNGCGVGGGNGFASDPAAPVAPTPHSPPFKTTPKTALARDAGATAPKASGPEKRAAAGGEPGADGRGALRAAFAGSEHRLEAAFARLGRGCASGDAAHARGESERPAPIAEHGDCAPGRGESLAAVIDRLDRKLTGLVETYKPGGGAADPSRPTTEPGQPLRRLTPSDYADGAGAPAGADRASARAISNAVSNDTGKAAPAGGPSDMFWAFGQFLDHDLDLTQGGAHGAGEPMPIEVPKGDPTFDPEGKGGVTLPFTRSAGVENAVGSRQQINTITALLDGSNVYGSTPEETAGLRSGVGGALRMGVTDAYGYEELPRDEAGRFYVAGDARANENAGLTAMHKVFAREHNRVAAELAAAHPDWSDDQLFAGAREVVTAQLQAITKNEFLPVLLGENALGAYEGYTGVDAQISNEFATAAFRFGHTMVSDSLLLIGDDGARRSVPLSQAFFDPKLVADYGVEDVLRGLATQSAQPFDAEIVDSLRNLVMNAPGSPRLDLAALNIQRGRDHGLPTLNDARAALGLDRLTGFDDPRLREGVGARLATVYESIDDVDLWVGLLSERPVGGGLAGETQALIVAEQFARTRDGDPNWYEGKFPPERVAEFDALRLSDIIERNSGSGDLQEYVLLTAPHGA